MGPFFREMILVSVVSVIQQIHEARSIKGVIEDSLCLETDIGRVLETKKDKNFKVALINFKMPRNLPQSSKT